MGMAEDVISDLHGRIGKTLDDLRRDLAKVRTGRANPQLLDSVRVDYYGTPTPLNQVANVTVADPRLIVIKPWEKSMIAPIEKAINASELGINPSNDGTIIRLSFPPLTQDRRKELIKVAKERAEEGKVAVRNVRRHIKDEMEHLEREGQMTEDDLRRQEKDLQRVTDHNVAEIDEVLAAKERELLEV